MKIAQEVAGTNTREIVLTGVNIGDFGKGSKETFYDLMIELNKLEGIDRIRISSIEPNLLTDQIIKYCAQSEIFMPHFHVPLQSGSNKILRKMKRRYKQEYYEDRVKKSNLIFLMHVLVQMLSWDFPGKQKMIFLKHTIS